MVLDFNDRESASIKSFAVKKKNEIKVTTRFMSGKLLMFAKLSLKSFIYSLAEIFCFPPAEVKEIYKKYQMESIQMYHVLTDTDSTSLQFIIVSDPNSSLPEPKIRDVIFEIIIATPIYKRFDTSHPFWDNFNARKEKIKKKLGSYETEHIDNPCYVTLAVNPKGYFGLFKDYDSNKNHKGIKKGSRGMEFENYANRLQSLVNFDTFEKPTAELKEVSRFTVDHGEMIKKTVVKTKFSQLNDKRFYFPDSGSSLPYGHLNLKESDNFKQEIGKKIEKYFWKEKEKLLEMEKNALKNTPSLYFYHQILMQHPKIVNINQKDDFDTNTKILIKKNTKRYYIVWTMDEIKYSYDGTFSGNVLIVGRTGCGKTSFVQNLDKNQLFGDIKEVFWISKLELSTDRESNIRDCFENQDVQFNYPKNVEHFDYLLEMCKRNKADDVENNLGGKKVMDKLIVMDGVCSGSLHPKDFVFFC